MIYLPTTKHCRSNKGVATFDFSANLPEFVGDSTSSEVYLVGHFLGSSFRVDHKTFSLDEAFSYKDSNSVIYFVYSDIIKYL